MDNNKLKKIMDLVNEIQEEENEKKKRLRQELLDKLNDDECNYFLIISDLKPPRLDLIFKTYGIKAEDYEEAYNTFENIIEENYKDDSDFNYFILHKDELGEMINSLKNIIKLNNNSGVEKNA